MTAVGTAVVTAVGTAVVTAVGTAVAAGALFGAKARPRKAVFEAAVASVIAVPVSGALYPLVSMRLKRAVVVVP